MDGGVGFDEPELSWSTQDIEQKIGFSGGRYTDTNAFFTFLVGLILSTLFFLVLEFVIGDSGTAAEWNEQNVQMVTLEDGTQEEQVSHIPYHIALADKFINRGEWGIFNGCWNNSFFLLGSWLFCL
jgi:hypothetical protein